MSNWLVTGAAGMLGRDLASVLSTQADVNVLLASRADLDITDASAVDAAAAGQDVVVNAAAWTDVDGAESDEPGAAAVNATGAANVAAACARSRCVLLQVSTDYVFPGEAATPYQENDPVRPINAYGRTKAAGEAAVLGTLPDRGFVIRTAWLYGEHGRNFVATILRKALSGEQLNVVEDAVGQPTWAYALARQLVAIGRAGLADAAPPGIYHATASGSTSWYGLALAVLELSGLDPALAHPVSSDAFPRPARRPAFSVLGHDSWANTGIQPLAHWRAMLAEALRSQAFAGLSAAAAAGRTGRHQTGERA